MVGDPQFDDESGPADTFAANMAKDVQENTGLSLTQRLNYLSAEEIRDSRIDTIKEFAQEQGLSEDVVNRIAQEIGEECDQAPSIVELRKGTLQAVQRDKERALQLTGIVSKEQESDDFLNRLYPNMPDYDGDGFKDWK